MDNFHGVIDSGRCYTLGQIAALQGGCDERIIKNFLKRHGYRPAEIARGYHQVSGYVWNLCVQREMLEACSETNKKKGEGHAEGD
jgi:hypothetical protein